MIYVADDPELGYFDEQDVRHTRHGLVAVDSDGEWIAYVSEATCSQCGRALAEDAQYALCPLHEGSSRQAGRDLAEAGRQEAEGRVG